MKKIVALFLALGMSLGVLSGCGSKKNTADSDLAYVQDKGVLVVGITDFAPMDYQNEAGEWIGFDADMAKAFADSLAWMWNSWKSTGITKFWSSTPRPLTASGTA